MLKKRHNTTKVFIALLAVLFFVIFGLVIINIKLNVRFDFMLAITSLVATGLTWIAFSLTVGREATIYVQATNYPPKGINSMKAGYIMDGELSTRNLISGLYYMACNGYLLIKEYNQHEFSFINLKFPENEDEAIQLFYNTIFGEAALETEVKLIDAKDRLIKAIPLIEARVKKSITKNKNRDIADMTGKVQGFKQSLIENKNEKILRITSDDPDYLFKVLPYAYAFAITSKLSSNFEPVKVKMPEWYSGYNIPSNYEFDVVFYNAMLKHLPEQFISVVIDELNFRIKTGLN